MATPVYIVAGQSNAWALNGGNGGASLAQEYQAITGSGDVVVRSVTSPGAPLTWGRSDPDWYHETELFQALVQAVKQALSQPDTYLASIIWIQGEGDAWSFARASEYAARLTALVHKLEAAMAPLDTQTHNFRFTVLSLSETCPAAADKPNWNTVRDQQLSLVDPRLDVVNVDLLAITAGQMFQIDGLHFAAEANSPVLSALLDQTAVRLIGTMYDDQLSGLSGHDTLRGGAGQDWLAAGAGDDILGGWTANDIIYGGDGRDSISGGAGRDFLYGGAGEDTFNFYAAGQMGTSLPTCDKIFDFQSGQDILRLGGIDADITRAGNQSFVFVGSQSFSLHAGEVRAYRGNGGMIIAVDTNGDARPDEMLFLAGVNSLAVTDFLL